MQGRISLSLLALAALVVWLSSASSPTRVGAQSATGTPTTTTIAVTAAGFFPQSVTVAAGSYVTFFNSDPINTHQPVSSSGNFPAVPPLGPGQSATVQFFVAGTYSYHDANNPSLTGTIIVQNAITPTATSTITPIPSPTSLTTASAYLSPDHVSSSANDQLVTVVGAGFAPNEQVTATYTARFCNATSRDITATATAASDGSVIIGNLLVPAGIAGGSYFIIVTGAASQRVAHGTLTVNGGCATSTAIPTPIPPPTNVPTAAPTNTPIIIIATPVPTAIPAPTLAPSIVIDHVALLHVVRSKQSETKSLHLGEKFFFLVVYHTVNPDGLVPSARVTVTKNGREKGSFKLLPSSFDGASAFALQATLIDRSMTGKLYAHFQLTLGPASAHRDRRFTLSA